VSNGNGNGNGNGGRNSGGTTINLTAVLFAGVIAFCYALSQGETTVPNIRNGVVDSPTEAPAAPPETCSTEEAIAVITASGLTVIEWQAAAGITADGEVGPQTRAAACG
jgi:peptidoglycan hydrolase-like protein with peptidoglycan-binding domain